MISDLFYQAFNKFMHGYNNFRVKKIQRSLKYCGKRVYISPQCIIWSESCLELGDDVCINSFTHIFAGGGVKIGDGAMISSNCSITSITHPSNSPNRLLEPNIKEPVIIGRNAWIGTGAILLPGVTVGDDAIVGAGSVVIKDVPPKTIVGGNPAKFLKNVGIVES